MIRSKSKLILITTLLSALLCSRAICRGNTVVRYDSPTTCSPLEKEDKFFSEDEHSKDGGRGLDKSCNALAQEGDKSFDGNEHSDEVDPFDELLGAIGLNFILIFGSVLRVLWAKNTEVISLYFAAPLLLSMLLSTESPMWIKGIRKISTLAHKVLLISAFLALFLFMGIGVIPMEFGEVLTNSAFFVLLPGVLDHLSVTSSLQVDNANISSACLKKGRRNSRNALYSLAILLLLLLGSHLALPDLRLIPSTNSAAICCLLFLSIPWIICLGRQYQFRGNTKYVNSTLNIVLSLIMVLVVLVALVVLAQLFLPRLRKELLSSWMTAWEMMRHKVELKWVEWAEWYKNTLSWSRKVPAPTLPTNQNQY